MRQRNYRPDGMRPSKPIAGTTTPEPLRVVSRSRAGRCRRRTRRGYVRLSPLLPPPYGVRPKRIGVRQPCVSREQRPQPMEGTGGRARESPLRRPSPAAPHRPVVGPLDTVSLGAGDGLWVLCQRSVPTTGGMLPAGRRAGSRRARPRALRAQAAVEGRAPRWGAALGTCAYEVQPPYGTVMSSMAWPTGSMKYTPRPPSLWLIVPGCCWRGSA